MQRSRILGKPLRRLPWRRTRQMAGMTMSRIVKELGCQSAAIFLEIRREVLQLKVSLTTSDAACQRNVRCRYLPAHDQSDQHKDCRSQIHFKLLFVFIAKSQVRIPGPADRSGIVCKTRRHRTPGGARRRRI
eukprot:637853-Hanusia_phi.AAC.1